MNYILDSNNNKISIKYSFATDSDSYNEYVGYGDDSYYLPSDCEYIITQDNKIYKVDYYNGINDYKIDLLNNKTVKNINYDSNNSVIIVTYTDNTSDKFNCDQYFNPDTNKYGF